MEGGHGPSLVVGRFLAAWPGETCERNRADAPLANTYWKVAILKGETLTPVEHAREASLVLHATPEPRVAATAGSNRMVGSYRLEGENLTFGQLASTMMACPPPLGAREEALAGALAATRSHAMAGSALVLYDAAHEPLVILKSVALR